MGWMTQNMKNARRRIQIITLGGTIAMRNHQGGLSPALGGDALLDFLKEIDFPFQIDKVEFSNVASANITFSDLIRLAQHITSLNRDDYVGVVVTQGTDTIEETAFALELLAQSTINIAVTGAMRSASHRSADGPANIISALRFLADSDGTGEVVVVLDDTVHSARYVRKTHTTKLSAFSSGEFGLRGRIHEERLKAYNKAPTSLEKLSVSGDISGANVLLLPICFDQEAPLLEHIVKIGPAGLVLESLGAGHVPQTLLPILEKAARKIPVVLCSRTNQGPICEHTYGYPGGEMDLLARGLISGGWLPGIKARMLLKLLLMNSPVDSKTRFSAYVRNFF